MATEGPSGQRPVGLSICYSKAYFWASQVAPDSRAVAPGRCARVVCAGPRGDEMIHLLSTEHLLCPTAALET